MGYIIVTSRNLLWVLLSLTAVMALVAGIITPKWLVGYERRPNSAASAYRPTIGLYNRCTQLLLPINKSNSRPLSCGRYANSLSDLPNNFWKASLVFIVFGSAITAISVLMALIGFCVQHIGKKSLIPVVGVIQAIAGLFLLIGMVLYPAGWGSDNEMVKSYCHKVVKDDDDRPSPFKIGDCSIGWAFYSALGGTLLVFLCAIFSVQAEKSTASDKVQDEIWKGKTVICLP